MVSRRQVLLGGALVGGGLIVGYAAWPGTRAQRAEALATGPTERLVATWIKIGSDDSIAVIVPHGDMGQGIFTALAQMAAEELDADWSKVRAEIAPPAPEFANGALAEGFILHDVRIPSLFAGAVDFAFRNIAEVMNLQITGGSSSVRFTGGYGIRLAAAAARDMLVRAAAKRWGVEPGECATELSRVHHRASGRALGYGELAGEAAQYTPSSTPRLKPRSEYKIVGQSMRRFDIPAKVDGSLAFAMDVRPEGLLYATVRGAPVFGGKLIAHDASLAAKMPGVKRVVALDDAVIVVADRRWRATKALEAVVASFSGGGNGDVDSAVIFARHDAALSDSKGSEDVEKGDAEKTLANAARVIAADYRVPYLAHAAMEPVNCTAWHKDGKLEVWVGTQDGLGTRAYCAETAGLSFDDVTLHQMAMGGSFGRKGEWSPNFLRHAVLTAMETDGPVQLVFSREEDMRQDYYRPCVVSRFRAALGPDGMPIAWENRYTGKNEPAEAAHIPYAIAHQSIRYVESPAHVPTGQWRSVAHSQHGYFTESFIDELAHEAGQDPYEFRRTLLRDAPRYRAVLDLAAQKAGWGEALPEGRGRGIALQQSFQSIVAQVAEVEVTADGALKIHRIVAAVDSGIAINPDGLKAQIEGGIVYGLTAALYGEIAIDKGAVVQANFPDYEMVRLADCPAIEVHILESGEPLGGAGEPGTPPAAPAIANAIFAATGRRLRSLPVKNHRLGRGSNQSVRL